MSDVKSTKLTLREDRPTTLGSSAHGSNIDAVAFNISFLAQRNPQLAITLLELYDQAHNVQEDDPKAPEEDFALFADALRNVISTATTDDFVE